MKKSAIFLKAVSKTTGLLAVLLTLSLVLAGCDNDSGGGGGDIDPALVAKWYDTQAHADAGGTTGLGYELKSDGKILVAGQEDQGNTFSTSGGKIMVYDNNGQITGTADYTIERTKLTLSNSSDSFKVPNGTFYKKQ